MNTRIIKKAIQIAHKSDMHPFKVGAVIFKNNRIISFGYNSKRFCGKIHPKYRSQYDSLHAEQDAILNVKDWSKLSSSSILVIRITRSGNISMAKPCDMCMSMIQHVGLKEIYYSNHDGEIIKEKIWLREI